jgi:hypothetical protein
VSSCLLSCCHLLIDLGQSDEYHVCATPLEAMMNELASVVVFSLKEAMAAS